MAYILEDTAPVRLSPFELDPSLPRKANIIIAGGGGFFLEIESFLRDMARSAKAAGETFEWTIGGVLEKGPHRNDSAVGDWPALGSEDEYEPQDDDYFIVALGEPKIRRKIAQKLAKKNARFFNVIHPTAFIAETATIGSGVIIAPACYIAARVTLEDHVVLHATSQVGHDSRLGAYSVLCPYSALSGFCDVGDTCFLGTGAVMAPNTNLGRFSKIAGGAFQVQKSIEGGSIVFGNPSEHRRQFKIPTD